MITRLYMIMFYLLALFRPSSRFLTFPYGPHFSYTSNPNELLFLWTSAFPQWGSSLAIRPLHDTTWTCITANYQWNYFRSGHGWNIVYTATVSELDPSLDYEYRIGAEPFWTSPRTISGRTAYSLAVNSDEAEEPADLIVFGDMGAGGFSKLTRDHISDFIQRTHIDAVMHTGDIVYNMDGRTFFLAREYFNEIEGFTSVLPYMVLPGNHERLWNFTQYSALFRMPDNPASANTSLFYSFDLGPAHFVAINTEFYLPEYQPSLQTQMNWLQSDLAAADAARSQVPWIVVFTHRPMYSFQIDKKTDDESQTRADIRSSLEPLLRHHQVDLVISSHEHCYERLAPLSAGYIVSSEEDRDNYHRHAQAPVYIISGTAGNEEGNDKIRPESDPRVLVISRLMGFGRLHIPNATHLLWQQFESINRTELDHVWLAKG